MRGKVRAAALWALPLVFVKEDQGFTAAAIGILIVIMSLARSAAGRLAAAGAAPRIRGQDRGAPGPRAQDGGAGTVALGWGALLTVWGLGWSLLAIAVIIPHFNPLHQYPYWTDGGVLSPGGVHPSAASVLTQFGHSYVPKLRTTLLILLPVAFLALGSPLALVALPGLALRFVSTNPAYWGSGYHYNATVMPIVFIAARRHPGPDPRLPGPARAAPGAHPQRVLAGPRGHPDRPRVMLVIAVALAGQFPLRDLWHPQPTRSARMSRGRTPPWPGCPRHHRRDHAHHAGPASRPG